MNFLRQVWLLCLLAIAGGGPLPLWMHHTLCHTCHTDSNAYRAEESTCQHSGCAHASVLAQTALTSDATASNDVGLAVSQADDHEDCAVCYLLSQASSAQAYCPTLVSEPLVIATASVADQLPWSALLLGYASRGPPVC